MVFTLAWWSAWLGNWNKRSWITSSAPSLQSSQWWWDEGLNCLELDHLPAWVVPHGERTRSHQQHKHTLGRDFRAGKMADTCCCNPLTKHESFLLPRLFLLSSQWNYKFFARVKSRQIKVRKCYILFSLDRVNMCSYYLGCILNKRGNWKKLALPCSH